MSEKIYIYTSTAAGKKQWIDSDAIGSGAITMVYPGAGIPISNGSGWGSSISNNSANWNTAYAWGNHATAGYLSSAVLSSYAPLDSPVFTGDVTMPGSGMWDHLGNVGIKNLSPATELDAAGRIRVTTLGTTPASGEGLEISYDGVTNHRGYIICYNRTGGVYKDLRLGLDTYLKAGGNAGFGFGSPLAKVAINGGLHIGGESDPGDNNLWIDGDSGSPAFLAGFDGSGWKLYKSYDGDQNLVLDNLTIRKALTAYELDINKINSINGGMIISAANGTSISATVISEYYDRIYFDEDGGNKLIEFQDNDYIRAQVWNGRGIASYIGKVIAGHVEHSNTYGEAYIECYHISGAVWDKMELVQIGNSDTAARQNLIYMSASDTNNPFIDMLTGVNDGSFAGKQVLRIGNLTGITDATFGALSGIGLYCANAYLTGSLYLPNAGITNEGSSTSSIRIYAGDTYDNRAGAPFRVTQDGSLTATSGFIGGWNIASTYLKKDTGLASTSSGLAPADFPFYAGAEYADRTDAPFRVSKAGYVIATKFILHYTLSDDIIASNDTEHFTLSNTLMKVKTLSLGSNIQGPLTLRIVFTIKTYASGNCEGQIYKNGSPVGTLRTATSAGSTFSEDIAGWESGDDIELWARAVDAFQLVGYKNFRLLGNFLPILNEVSGTNTYDYNYI